VKAKHKLTYDVSWQIRDLYESGYSFQAIRRRTGFSGWQIGRYWRLETPNSRKFFAMGRPEGKDWHEDIPDPKFRGPLDDKKIGVILKEFWAQVNKHGRIMPHMNTCCWEWTGKRRKDGYGWASRKPGIMRASRLSYILEHGIIPKFMSIFHRCDNPCCVRPSHLFHGRLSANAQDRDRKGRGNLCAGNRVV